MKTSELLNEREASHGRFEETAQTAQAIKSDLRCGGNWCDMTHAQREGLDMIANKLARIANGDADFLDHWADIAGYATLVARGLDPECDL